MTTSCMARPATYRHTVAAAVVTMLATAVADAQDVWRPVVVQLPVSVRALGMGGVWTGGKDPDALFHNPALVGSGVGLIVGGGRYARGAVQLHGTSTMAMGSNGIGVGFTRVTYDAAYAGAVNPLPASDANGAVSSVAALGGSLTVRGIRWGLGLKVAEERVGGSADAMPLADVGAAKDVGPLSLGLVVQNIGGDLAPAGADARTPLRVGLGATTTTYLWHGLDVIASLGAVVRRDGRVSGGGGVEATYVPLDGYVITGRVGVRHADLERFTPLTLGASFGLDRFTLDYAFESLTGNGGGAHHLALRVR